MVSIKNLDQREQKMVLAHFSAHEIADNEDGTFSIIAHKPAVEWEPGMAPFKDGEQARGDWWQLCSWSGIETKLPRPEPEPEIEPETETEIDA